MPQYQQFFDELALRLEIAQKMEPEMELKLDPRFNALNYPRPNELNLSKIIEELLNPKGSHGQGALFLKLLLDRLEHFSALSDLDQACVEVEKTIKDGKRLDICLHIEDGGRKHCLAIENKPYAKDQKNQVKDYLDWLRHEYDHFMLIYLSSEGEPPSTDSVKLAYLEEGKEDQAFKIMPYHKTQEDVREDGFDDFRLAHSLTDWLEDCRNHCEVGRLHWFLGEIKMFCEQEFGGNNMTDSELKAIKEFVLSSKKNLDASLAICNSLPEIKNEVYSRFLEMILDTWLFYFEYLGDAMSVPYRKEEHYIGMCRKRWKQYDASKTDRYGGRTQLYLEVDSDQQCSIGVWSPEVELTAEEKERRQKLIVELKDLGNSEGEPSEYYLWWKWVDEGYRDWNCLTSAIYDECKNSGGKITNYFVREFATLAKKAIPIINCIEGS